MKNKIYVICPYGLVTGGPDALHQMVYYLNRNGYNAYIVYCDIKSYKYSIPESYKCYVSKYLILNDIDDEQGNAIIIPETETHLLKDYSNLKKYIWWLSVDNDINSSGFVNKCKKVIKKIRFKNFKKLYKVLTLKNFLQHKKYDFKNDKDIIHLCASYYAYDYVLNNCNYKDNVKLCIEPISKYFLDNVNFNTKNRKDLILFNPKKNYKFTKKIMKYEKKYTFLPLKGFSQEQLINLYSSSKLYIDFGNFPGAERIPKEAVINGCCILTGKFGASAFFNDVPINDEYKFDGTVENIPKIIKTIDQIMECYDKKILDFENYRKTVLELEKNFIVQINNIFESYKVKS